VLEWIGKRNMRMQAVRHEEQGFTLIELLIVIMAAANRPDDVFLNTTSLLLLNLGIPPAQHTTAMHIRESPLLALR
jgi:prepilin-type N-terminal cleavage/methylation domain-containing protein